MRVSTRGHRLWTGVWLLSLTFVIWIISSPVQAQSPEENLHAVVLLDSGWQYRWGDSPVGEDGVRRWLLDKPDSDAWRNLPASTLSPSPAENKILWMRIQLPDKQWPDAGLFMDSVDQGVEVYLDRALIYSAGLVDRAGNEPALGTTHHLIPLPPDFQGKMLVLRIYSQYNTIGPKNGVFIGAQTDHLLNIIKTDIDRFVIAWISIAIGLVAVGFFLRRPEQKAYLALGILAASAGVFTLFRTHLIELFTTSSFLQEYSKLISLYLLPVGLCAFFEQVVSAGRWSIVRRLWQICLIYSIAAIGLSLLGVVQPLSTVFPFEVLASIALIILVVISIQEALRGNVDARLFTIGYSLVFLFALLTMLDDLGILLLPRRVFHWGVFGFILMLVFILLRRFNLVQQQLQNYSQQLELKSKEMEAKNEELSHIDKLKDEFLANTSHELRTPLNGIIGMAETLIDGATGPLSEKTRRHLSMIVFSGRRLASLVNDILDFSRLKHQEINLQLGSVNMKSAVDVVFMLSQPLLGNKHLRLVNQIPSILPPIEADENRVQQILHNLVDNAIKFTESGQVQVSAQLKQLSQNGTPHPATAEVVQIVVADTGIGISPDKFKRIFESFEQADGSTARKYGGTGLGLTVTRQLVELHGGQIRVDSTVGQGSRFIFTLPVKQNAHAQSEITPKVESPPLSDTLTLTVPQSTDLDTGPLPPVPSPKNKNIVILIVDDEPINLQVLSNQLELQNYSVIQTTSGLKALELAEQHPKPDLILLDVMMPHMSGYEVCRALRQKYTLTELPILMLTAKNRSRNIVEGFQAGANDYLTKPVNRNELLARVSTLLALKQATRSQAELLTIQQELEIAHRIQQNLLASPHPDWARPDTICYSKPARQMGGDLYAYHTFDDRHFAVVVGDVSGKGMPAALLMAVSLGSLQAVIDHVIAPSELLAHLDQVVAVYTRKIRQNCALCYVEIALPESEVGSSLARIANAGCVAPIVRRIKDGSVEWIDVGGIPLGAGLGAQLGYQDVTLNLSKGDMLILTSDGVVEANAQPGKDTPGDEMYGFKRFEQAVSSGPTTCAESMLEHLKSELATFTGNAEPYDDITMVVVQV